MLCGAEPVDVPRWGGDEEPDAPTARMRAMNVAWPRKDPSARFLGDPGVADCFEPRQQAVSVLRRFGAGTHNICVPTYRDHAVVLRTHKLGEADRIITLLCRSRGKVRAVARGVRRTSSKFGARLEPFTQVDIQLAVGRSLDVVTQVECLHPYGDPLTRDYGLYTAGETMLEVADRLVAMEHEPALQQYRLLVGALHVLTNGTTDGPRPATMVLDSYLLRSLAVAGYAPVLDSCAHCGTEGQQEWFSPSVGGMVCSGCRPPGSARPEPESWAHLGALMSGDWPATRTVDPHVCHEVSGMVAAFSSWHLEHQLRSLALVPRG